MKPYILVILLILIGCNSNNEIKLVKYNQSVCDPNMDITNVKSRIVNSNIERDTLHLTISMVANCGGIYYAEAKMKDDTVNINYKDGTVEKVKLESGKVVDVISQVSCDCCFEFYFSIVGLKSSPQYLKVNDELIK